MVRTQTRRQYSQKHVCDNELNIHDIKIKDSNSMIKRHGAQYKALIIKAETCKGQEAHKTVLNICSYQRKANKNHTKIQAHAHQDKM